MFYSIFLLHIYYFDIIVSSRASFCFFEAYRKILDNIILECLSVPLCGLCFMLLTVYTFASSCLHLLPCLTTAGCRLSNTFCSLPYCCFPLVGYNLLSQRRKATCQQAKAASCMLAISGHVLAASSKCLCLLFYLWDFKGMGFSHDGF